MNKKGKYYFASDVHLGLYPPEQSREREKLFAAWLKEISSDAREVFLCGDIFDFWHEWKHVVPRGFTRVLGAIAHLTDNGIPVHFFTGNHDIWIYDYLEKETGVDVHRKHIVRELEGKRFFIGHGDAVGKGDIGYKLLKGIFTNKVLQWLFARLHPNFSMMFGLGWSKKSRYSKGIIPEEFQGVDKEYQPRFVIDTLKNQEHFDYFVFGHRHIPMDITFLGKTRMINLGDWINSFTYGIFDGVGFDLKVYQNAGNPNILKLNVDKLE
ncbi:MAG: UDP-2,3-diacylglucosamine diphosphatase [Bacteroidota bacterium]